jgi:hypothetical protein
MKPLAQRGPELDLRTYKLVAGGRETFDRILREHTLPMLRRHEIDVVGFGPSLADDDHYYLARAFPSASAASSDSAPSMGATSGARATRTP